MKKMRHENYFIQEDLKGIFKWINSVKPIRKFIPTSKETYCIDFMRRLEDFEYQYDAGKSERKRFEEFVLNFYEVNKRRNRVIFCWRETEVIISVLQ